MEMVKEKTHTKEGGVKITGLPNILTLFRIAVIPVVVGLLFFKTEWTNFIAAALFLVAGITDYLDGYFARAWKQTTNMGRFLDPIADKLLIASTLMMLVGTDRIEGISLIPAVIILCREILVSGLREFLAEMNAIIPVTPLAKWKTTLQMFAIGFLVLGDQLGESIPITTFALVGLWAAALLTLITGYDYFSRSLKYFKDK